MRTDEDIKLLIKGEKKVYIVVNKKTDEEEIMLIKGWGIIPMFTKKKYALEFKKEQTFPKDLKVIRKIII